MAMILATRRRRDDPVRSRDVGRLAARHRDQLGEGAGEDRVRELLDLTRLLTGVRRRSRHVWQRLNPNREVRVEP